MTRALPLRERVIRAGGWSLLGHGVGQLLRLITSLLMTRLLAPEMFGVMLVATMVGVVVHMLSDIGLPQSIVQSPRGDDPNFLDTAWTIQVLRGIGLWVITLILAYCLTLANTSALIPMNSVYASPDLPLIIALTSFAAVIFGFQSTSLASAQRIFDQKQLIQIGLISQGAALIPMVIVGFLTRSVWALVVGGLVSSLITTVLSHLWSKGQKNRFRLEKESVLELIGFGKWVLVSSAVTVLAANGDRLLLSAITEPEVLGLYSIAILVVGAIEGAVTRLFSAVSLPALSEISRRDPIRLREVYYKLRIPGDTALLFLAGFFFMTGQLAIDAMYDERYSSAGKMLQILVLSLIFVRFGVAHQVYLAVGVTRNLAIINVVRFATLFSIVPLLYYFLGLSAAIWGIALHAVVTLPLIFYFNAALKLNDWRKELMLISVFPIGVIFGWLISQAFNH